METLYMSTLRRASGALVFVFILFYSAAVWFQEGRNKVLITWNKRSSFNLISGRKESDSIRTSHSPPPAQNEHHQCKSRIEQHRYRKKPWEYVPSEYLIARLRSYDEFHARCTRGYLQTWFNSTAAKNSDCKFILWLNYSGLGNKMVSIAAAFLYALLTRRVLLIDPGKDMDELFCEPFPRSSWFAPRDFPFQFVESDKFKLKFEKCEAGANFARYGYIEIMDGVADIGDKFFCEKQQQIISDQIAWLSIRANLYFVPSLYYVPKFRTELDKLFPRQEAVFHHLAKHLFHPSNEVWGRVTRFYDAYMAGSSKLVGVQLRMLPDLEYSLGGFHARERFSAAMIQCLHQSNVLPKVVPPYSTSPRDCRACGSSRDIIGVVVTSLDEDYSDDLKEVYLNSPTIDGSLIRVFAPSNERWQQTNDLKHDEKALAEIFLLSLCDELVTSPGSTFGYVAQSLGGLKPWLLNEGNCSRLDSIEPCFHARVFYGCDCESLNPAKAVQNNIQSCPDLTWGIQLVPPRF